MTIADKVRRAKTDLDEVHAAGVEEGKALGGYTEGYEDGKKSEYDAFWDAVQVKGTRTDYSYCFRYWGGEYIRPKYKVVPTDARFMICTCPELKKIESAYFDLSNFKGTHGYNFNSCDNLEEVEDIGLQPSTIYDHTFAWCYKLRKVACIRLDENTNVTNLLYSCNALEDVTIEGTIGQDGLNLRHSTMLSKASITSIINHLSDTASGKTLTLSITAVSSAFGASAMDWDGDGTIDGWVGGTEEWNALISSKSNWNIIGA